MRNFCYALGPQMRQWLRSVNIKVAMVSSFSNTGFIILR